MRAYVHICRKFNKVLVGVGYIFNLRQLQTEHEKGRAVQFFYLR